MAGKINARLEELGITLPQPNKVLANYSPYVISGNQIFISGQLTIMDGELKYLGRLGENLTVEDGMAAARLCCLNMIAVVNDAVGGDLDRITRVIRLGGFVASTPEFTDQHKVINGASDLMAEVFGDVGIHARAAVGVAALPLGVSVEIDGIFEFA